MAAKLFKLALAAALSLLFLCSLVAVYILDQLSVPVSEDRVFTIEPGLYISENDADAPEAFRGLGVRIEDDVVVTTEGIENLTSAIPKTAEDIEAWVNDSA